MSVSTRPGCTEQTRNDGSSARSESANARSANFDAAYDPQPGRAASPAPEFTQTTVPRAARSAGSSSRVSSATATTFTSNWLPPGVGGQFRDGAEQADPGRVDEDVDLVDPLRRGGKCGGVGEVYRPGQGARPETARDGGQRRAVPPTQQQVMGGGERRRDGRPDTAGGAGDEGERAFGNSSETP